LLLFLLLLLLLLPVVLLVAVPLLPEHLLHPTPELPQIQRMLHPQAHCPYAAIMSSTTH
jgi:hypothetical protein